jgi:hypothetical protein
MSDEEKYRKLRENLRNMPRVKARNDFDNKLYARLRNVESERMSPSVAKLTQPARERGWIFSLLKPSFAPAIGLTVIVLVAVIWYFAAYNPTTQDKQVSTSENMKQGTTQPNTNQNQEKLKENTIAKNESSPEISSSSTGKNPVTTEPKSDFNEVLSAPDRRSSDYESVPKVEPEKEKLEEFKTFDIAPVEPEKKMEKRGIEDSKKIEKKEAPANMKKEDSDKNNKNNEQKIDSKANDEIYNNINQSVQETPKQKDSTKDSAKSKGLKKNIGKSQNDSLNIQSIKKSQEPDSTGTKK